ncbi:hypothetical protein P3T76_015081 [Phytophthora citrophthora]|uniref:Uncharacterized protein n=1 Tax=Phytophthora citrophthora TaxID=4793 RepID=A0AAD9FZU5_9STRA|nr:hypothetical protein P3T76_015081 [Phytophthora citrophthora]
MLNAHKRSQNGSTLDSRSRHSTSQQQSRFKSQATHSYGSPAHHATAGKAYNKRLFSRSQPYRESNTPPLNASADKPVADWPRRQPPQPATPRFSSKEKYSSVHFKGLAAMARRPKKPIQKPSARHFTSGTISSIPTPPPQQTRKKAKFDVRTLIQAYSQD